MTEMLDDDMTARISDFTSWAASRGLKVIGGLIGPVETPNVVRVFTAAPRGSNDIRHTQELARMLYAVVLGRNGNIKEILDIPLGEV
jgi:hypothetical protein